MKILVFGPENRFSCYRPAFANQLDAQLVFLPPHTTPLEAARANPDAEVIFSDTIYDINAELMALLPHLKLIQSEGVAYHRFDVEAAARRNIFVCNCKGCNASSVAEHTVMLMLMALRFGITGHNAVREGRQFEMKEQVMASNTLELGDCAVGLVGFGDIAQATARRLAPFGCRLYYNSLHRQSADVERDFGITYLPLEELVSTCHIVSLHCAVNDSTRNLVDSNLLQHFSPGAVLVNTARGELMDNAAVRQALLEGRLSCLAADTLFPEPTPKDHPLVDLPPEIRDRAIYSPHLGGNTGGAFRRAHETMWNNAKLILEGKRPIHIVNNL